ncbi:MAG: GlsB/YeaQ/YmgE family stress response membrane protein [Gemmatimonadetes bacterium]|nr:GlsB/YeaQ/YmgE family stress response membrane protein [Gemmatimonadota bacterium]
MDFITGFAVWVAIGLVAGFIARTVVRADDVVTGLTLLFGIFGAFIGGMLGTAAYVHHNAIPLRPGSLIGATAGALFFSMLYHFMAKKAT